MTRTRGLVAVRAALSRAPRAATVLLAVGGGAGIAACGGSGHHASTTRTTGGATSATSTTLASPSRTLPSRPESSILPQLRIHYPTAPPADQTAPTVTPTSGTTKTVFVVHLNVRSHLGAHGYARLDYEVLMAGIHPRCGQWTELDAARFGTRAEIVLRPPFVLGWCAGPYNVRVLLQTNPSCPPRTSTSAPPCRTYPTRYAVVGRFTFVTR